MLCALPTERQISASPGDDGIRPGKAWYALALVLFLVCTTGIIAAVYYTIHSFPEGTQFLVPGSLNINVEKPGTYVLWDELTTLFQGKSYQSSAELPGGMEIKIREAQTDRSLQLFPSLGGAQTTGQVKRRSIGTVSLDRPGAYVIDVTGDFPRRVFFFRRSVVSTVLSGVAAVALLGLTGWIIAPVIALIVFLKRSNARKRATQQIVNQAPAPDQGATGAMTTKEERTFAMFCHLGALSGYVIPFASIIVPLLLWIIKKEESPFINMHGKESVNFQISMLIYSIFSAMLVLLIIGIFLLAGLWIFNLVVVIIAGVRASGGAQFRYPLTIRFIR